MKKQGHLRPFVIGLIGHRELSEHELPRLQREFDTYIEELLNVLKNTPILVLTSIAEGADRFAHNSKFRDQMKICAVLPMRKEAYAKDFKTKQSLESFHTTLHESEYVFVLEGSAGQSWTTSNRRNRAYAACGRWISDKSNALFVVWDGRNSRGVGGTSDSVNYRQNSLSVPAHLLRGGLSITHVFASNSGSTVRDNCDCGGHSGMSPRDQHVLLEFDRLNYHLRNSEVLEIDSSLELDFQIFDQEAISLQKMFSKRTKLVLVLGVLFMNLSSFHIDQLKFLTLAPVVVVLLITLVAWKRLTSSRIKSAYETFRLMAEILRVQIWWRSCGIKEDVLSQIPEFREIESSARLFIANTFLSNELEGEPKLRQRRTSESPKMWIIDQIAYLGTTNAPGAIAKNELKSSKLKLLIYSALSLSGASLLMGTFLSSFGHKVELVQQTTSILFTFFISSAAAIAAFLQVMSFQEIANRFRVKTFRLKQALSSLESANKESEALEIAMTVGTDSLSEAFNWYRVKSEKQVRPFQ